MAAATECGCILVLSFVVGGYHDWTVSIQVDTLGTFVDYIVVSEMDTTFQGTPKPFLFEEKLSENEKVVYIKRSCPTHIRLSEARDFFQRDGLTLGVLQIRKAHPDARICVILVDADEFIDPKCFDTIRTWASTVPLNVPSDMFMTRSIPMLLFIGGFHKVEPQFWRVPRLVCIAPNRMPPSLAAARWGTSLSETTSVLCADTEESARRALCDRKDSLALPLRGGWGVHLSSFEVRDGTSKPSIAHEKLTSWAHGTEDRTFHFENALRPSSRVVGSNETLRMIACDASGALCMLSEPLRSAIGAALSPTCIARTGVVDPLPTLVVRLAQTLSGCEADIDSLFILVALLEQAHGGDALNALIVTCSCRDKCREAYTCPIEQAYIPYVLVRHAETDCVDPADWPMCGVRCVVDALPTRVLD